MNSNKMFLSLVPWLVFSILIHRLGADAAWLAALIAAGLGAVLLARNSGTGVKLIDLVGVGTFGVLTVACLIGGSPVDTWVADYGRGASTLLLGAVMLVSVAVIPFSMQYAKEGVPREYWDTPEFRAINQRISALWGAILLIMGVGHLVAGAVDPISVDAPGLRPVDFLLNWVVPVALILLGVSATRRLADAAHAPQAPEPTPGVGAGRPQSGR